MGCLLPFPHKTGAGEKQTQGKGHWFLDYLRCWAGVPALDLLGPGFRPALDLL